MEREGGINVLRMHLTPFIFSLGLVINSLNLNDRLGGIFRVPRKVSQPNNFCLVCVMTLIWL